VSDGPFRDNNLDLIRAENEQLKREVALIKRERKSHPLAVVNENRNLIFALAVLGVAAATQTWALLWLLFLISFSTSKD
jgi:hypothetical protein